MCKPTGKTYVLKGGLRNDSAGGHCTLHRSTLCRLTPHGPLRSANHHFIPFGIRFTQNFSVILEDFS